jgi:hypothetical protein
MTIRRAVPYNKVMRRLGLAVALAGLAILGAGCAATHHANASMRPGGILASGNCWNVRTHRGTVTRTRFKCSDYHPVVYQQGSAPRLPLVIPHPAVKIKDLPNATRRHLTGRGGRLISPTQLAFMTTGSSGCLWLPTRLTVLSPTAIRIDMRFPLHRTCAADLIGLPIAVKINPRIVDVHRPLAVQLAYKANYCCGEPSKSWHRNFIAPAIPRL